MRQDVKAKVYEVTKASDGYGGEIETLVYLYTIYCAYTAFGETEQDKKYGKDNKHYFKVITTYNLPIDKPYKLEINGHMHDPYSDREFGIGNRRAVMVERVR